MQFVIPENLNTTMKRQIRSRLCCFCQADLKSEKAFTLDCGHEFCIGCIASIRNGEYIRSTMFGSLTISKKALREYDGLCPVDECPNGNILLMNTEMAELADNNKEIDNNLALTKMTDPLQTHKHNQTQIYEPKPVKYPGLAMPQTQQPVLLQSDQQYNDNNKQSYSEKLVAGMAELDIYGAAPTEKCANCPAVLFWSSMNKISCGDLLCPTCFAIKFATGTEIFCPKHKVIAFPLMMDKGQYCATKKQDQTKEEVFGDLQQFQPTNLSTFSSNGGAKPKTTQKPISEDDVQILNTRILSLETENQRLTKSNKQLDDESRNYENDKRRLTQLNSYLHQEKGHLDESKQALEALVDKMTREMRNMKAANEKLQTIADGCHCDDIEQWFAHKKITGAWNTKELYKASKGICIADQIGEGKMVLEHVFNCLDCNLVFPKDLCSVCAAVCHQGHKIVYDGYALGSCNCGQEGNQCQVCINVEVEDDQNNDPLEV